MNEFRLDDLELIIEARESTGQDEGALTIAEERELLDEVIRSRNENNELRIRLKG